MSKRIVAVIVPANMSFEEFIQKTNAAKRTDTDQIVIASVAPHDVSKEAEVEMWKRAAYSREECVFVQVTGPADPKLKAIAETVIA